VDKIIAVLEYINNKDKSWEEIYRYCEKIGLDPLRCRIILTDPKNPLVIEAKSLIKPSLKGQELVANSRRTTAILGEDWA
jgi:hypothetical protein